MDALLTQLPAMIGVLIGVVGTLVTTTVADRGAERVIRRTSSARLPRIAV
jgi:hypothetical protein